MVQRIILRSVPPFPQPHVQLNKWGKPTKSIGKYQTWKLQTQQTLRHLTFKIPDPLYAIIFGFYHKPKPGNFQPDVSNMQKGVEDALKDTGKIKDDNWKILPRYYSFIFPVTDPYTELFFPQNNQEMIQVLTYLEKEGLV